MSSARVLVVDDEPQVLALVAKALARRGYEVQAVRSPLEALDLARATPCFDLVVSDVIMPEMRGPELLKRIAEICPAAAAVVMSAHIEEETLPAHAIFLSKPFAISDLYSVIDRALTKPAV